MTTFAALGVSRPLQQVCSEMGIRTPTPVQAACIPPTLAGRNVIGAAPTGSGKTAAFALPILHQLAKDPYGVFALVLTPTRELALQICEQFSALGRPLSARCAAVIGGTNSTAQLATLADNPHVIVATPGRLIEHLRTNRDQMHLARVRFLVLDEADRLLSPQFEAALGEILAELPPSSARQTLYFSATMTPSLTRLLQLSSAAPFRYDESPLQPLAVVRDVTQRYVRASERAKVCFLVYALRSLIESNAANQAIVFTSTCRRAQQLAIALGRLRIASSPLHSMLPQAERIRSLNRLRSGQIRVLAATDVAARGLDIPGVSLVVHLDFPREAAAYVHRTGRTARAGRAGESLAIIDDRDVPLMREVEGKIGSKLTEWVVRSDDIRYHLRESVTAWRLANAHLARSGFDEQEERRKAAKRALPDNNDG